MAILSEGRNCWRRISAERVACLIDGDAYFKALVDAIAAAKEFIYIENQYLTSMAVARALKESLQQDKGPEIVIVLPRKSSGWLEQSTMDAIRAHIVNQLEKADTHNRLRILYPASAEGQNTVRIKPIVIGRKKIVFAEIEFRPVIKFFLGDVHNHFSAR
jgi:hypothetical protein